jgi:hypothetical protein
MLTNVVLVDKLPISARLMVDAGRQGERSFALANMLRAAHLAGQPASEGAPRDRSLALLTLPTFRTARLILRPRTIADYDACLAMDRRSGRGALHAGTMGGRASPPGIPARPHHPQTAPDRFLGWVLLIPRDAVGPEIEIGWRLVQAAWGQGYASEAAAAIVRHGFETTGLDRVIAEIHPEHVRSQRVAEKLGLRRARAEKLLLYEITREGFVA